MTQERTIISNYPLYLITDNVNRIERNLQYLNTSEYKTYKDIKGERTTDEFITYLSKNYISTQNKRNELTAISARFK